MVTTIRSTPRTASGTETAVAPVSVARSECFGTPRVSHENLMSQRSEATSQSAPDLTGADNPDFHWPPPYVRLRLREHALLRLAVRTNPSSDAQSPKRKPRLQRRRCLTERPLPMA